MKSKSNWMENKWEIAFNWIFQNDAIIEFKFDIHQSCQAWQDLSFTWKLFSNLLSKFWEKLRIKTYTIENV